MDLLENKVAVVTGSGRGIGEAIARKLASFGAKVVITDIVEETAKGVAEDLVAQGVQAKYCVFNVSDFAHIKENVSKIHELFGRIDIWVNNAGITEIAHIEDITEQRWDRMQNIDLKAVFFCSQAVYEYMKEQNYGRLIQISSMAGRRGGHSSAASYSAAKAGVINIAKSFALNGGKYNITSNAICPGEIVTEMSKDLDWFKNSDPAKTIPLARFGTPDDIANAVVFFASDLSSYVSGATLDVNGGLYMC